VGAGAAAGAAAAAAGAGADDGAAADGAAEAPTEGEAAPAELALLLEAVPAVVPLPPPVVGEAGAPVGAVVVVVAAASALNWFSVAAIELCRRAIPDFSFATSAATA
jgi:hypothetical protein